VLHPLEVSIRTTQAGFEHHKPKLFAFYPIPLLLSVPEAFASVLCTSLVFRGMASVFGE
jgi:hypothetical protein